MSVNSTLLEKNQEIPKSQLHFKYFDKVYFTFCRKSPVQNQWCWNLEIFTKYMHRYLINENKFWGFFWHPRLSYEILCLNYVL